MLYVLGNYRGYDDFDWFVREILGVLRNIGGEGGIRTPDELTPITVFKTAAFNRSATSP